MQIEELSRSKSGISRFLKVPYGIYRDDPNWVAPLLADLKTVFTDRNPLFQHAEMKLWVARRDGRDVGRIAGIIDRNHNDFHQRVDRLLRLLRSGERPGRRAGTARCGLGLGSGKGMNRLLGPMNPTTNDECGLLVDGFDSPPVIMMTYNPRYYVDLLEGGGVHQGEGPAGLPLPRRSQAAGAPEPAGGRRRAAEPGLVVRPIRRKTLRADLAKVKEVYNAAWERNWGFVPMTDAELDFMAVRLKPLLVEEITLLAELNGEPVGFMMSLPDYNVAIQPLKGKLLTPRVLNFARYLLGWKRPTRARVITLGIKAGFRQRGIDAMLFARSMQAGIPYGFREVEISWMLEDNLMILRPLAGVQRPPVQDLPDLRAADLRKWWSDGVVEWWSGRATPHCSCHLIPCPNPVIRPAPNPRHRQGKQQARQDVDDVVVAAIDGRDEHAQADRQQDQEEPAALPQRQQEADGGEHHVAGGEDVVLVALDEVHAVDNRAGDRRRVERRHGRVCGGECEPGAAGGDQEVADIGNVKRQHDREDVPAKRLRRPATPDVTGDDERHDEVLRSTRGTSRPSARGGPVAGARRWDRSRGGSGRPG